MSSFGTSPVMDWTAKSVAFERSNYSVIGELLRQGLVAHRNISTNQRLWLVFVLHAQTLNIPHIRPTRDTVVQRAGRQGHRVTLPDQDLRALIDRKAVNANTHTVFHAAQSDSCRIDFRGSAEAATDERFKLKDYPSYTPHSFSAIQG